jgi:rhamnosyltransferase
MISIIIPTKNGSKTLGSLLSKVVSQKDVGEIEIIVIDSGPSAATTDIAGRFEARVVAIPASSFHHGRTRNLAAKEARGEVLVFLNQDAIPLDDLWLKALVAPFSAFDNVAATYGRQLPADSCNPANRFRVCWNYGSERIVKNKDIKLSHEHRLYFFSTANCAIIRSIWQRFPFPEDLEIFEDTSFAKRVIDNGYSIVYEPAACVVHSHNFTLREIFQRYERMGYVQMYNDFLPKLGESHFNEGLDYVAQGLKQMVRSKEYFSIFYFLIHVVSGYMGLRLGRIRAKRYKLSVGNPQ